MGRLSATLERKKPLICRVEWAGRFCPLTALASACGGIHHGAQATFSATNIASVKCFHLDLTRTRANRTKAGRIAAVYTAVTTFAVGVFTGKGPI